MSLKNDSDPTDADLQAIRYKFWTLLDRKFTSFTILSLAFFLSLIVYLATEKSYLAFVVFGILLGSVARIFVPMQFEITVNGISRWTFGYRRDIFWSEIRSFVIQEEGILILPNSIRFPLDAFYGIFIPIPKKYRIIVQRRFLHYMERNVL